MQQNHLPQSVKTKNFQKFAGVQIFHKFPDVMMVKLNSFSIRNITPRRKKIAYMQKK